MCLILQEGEQQVNAIGGFNEQMPLEGSTNNKGRNEIEHKEFGESNEPTCHISEQTGISRETALPNRAKSKIERKCNYAAKWKGVRICQPEEGCLRQYDRPEGKEEKEILEIFHKVQVNIPLVETIKQIPRYVKFLKDLCTNKRKLYGYEKFKVGENVSAVLHRKIAQNCKDKDKFAISCKVGNLEIKKAMCDLGASINVMPLSVYLSLDAGPLKQTGITLQLVDRSIVYPKGVLEDVLIQVEKLIFLADLFVLDMEDDSSSNSTDLLLGRPFLSTARTKIDVHEGTLTMEFDGQDVKFNIYDAMKYPDKNFSLCNIDVVEPLAQEAFELSKEDKLEVVLTENLIMDCPNNSTLKLDEEIIETIRSLDASSHKASKIELKAHPAPLKYVFLESNDTFPIIFSSN
ncbi:uncharacterized protein LOC122723329 [Manihot esculenta]|uniref:uncharacterized protein LOC122723329 n=1 Tax=Manihot esculenta TaxID=3983 RepID=UPI001CC5D341|nr:uncharacterized protein LOC122723329 [Manihot esculenta]